MLADLLGDEGLEELYIVYASTFDWAKRAFVTQVDALIANELPAGAVVWRNDRDDGDANAAISDLALLSDRADSDRKPRLRFVGTTTDRDLFHTDAASAILHLVEYRHALFRDEDALPPYKRPLWISGEGGVLTLIGNSLTFGCHYLAAGPLTEPAEDRLRELLLDNMRGSVRHVQAPENLLREQVRLQVVAQQAHMERDTYRAVRERQFEVMYRHEVWQKYLRGARAFVTRDTVEPFAAPASEAATMYALPVAAFLGMGQLRPFEELGEQLVALHTTRVTGAAPLWFCSHKWFAFDRPDRADGALYAALCEELRGQQGLVWIDFCCTHQADVRLREAQLARIPQLLRTSCMRFLVHAFDADSYARSAWCAVEYLNYAHEAYRLLADYVVLEEVELHTLGAAPGEVRTSLLNIVDTPPTFGFKFEYRRRADAAYLRRTLESTFVDFFELYNGATLRDKGMPGPLRLAYKGPEPANFCCALI